MPNSEALESGSLRKKDSGGVAVWDSMGFLRLVGRFSVDLDVNLLSFVSILMTKLKYPCIPETNVILNVNCN